MPDSWGGAFGVAARGLLIRVGKIKLRLTQPLPFFRMPKNSSRFVEISDIHGCCVQLLEERILVNKHAVKSVFYQVLLSLSLPY